MSAGISRRGLAGLPAVALLAAPAKVDDRDAVLLTRVDDFVAYMASQRAELATWSAEDQAMAHACGLKLAREGILTGEDRRAAAIAKIPAHTPEGHRAKARAAIWQAGGDDTSVPRILVATGILGTLLADLTGIPCSPKGSRA